MRTGRRGRFQERHASFSICQLREQAAQGERACTGPSADGVLNWYGSVVEVSRWEEKRAAGPSEPSTYINALLRRQEDSLERPGDCRTRCFDTRTALTWGLDGDSEYTHGRAIQESFNTGIQASAAARQN